jgi:hypothetical protein
VRVVSTPAPPSGRLGRLVAPILLTVWGFGCALVLARWVTRWSNIHWALRQSTPYEQLRAPIPLRLSASDLEPGVVGILHPVLVAVSTR